jgi:hypothetical protein
VSNHKVIKQSELNRLCQQLHDLREALRPFATIGALVPADADGPLLRAHGHTVTLDDLRRAAALLRSLEHEDTVRWVEDAEVKMTTLEEEDEQS